MDINKIKQVVNSSVITDAQKESYILSILSEDKNVIPMILGILDAERDTNRDVLLETNAELSRALVVLKDNNLKWNKKIIADPEWVVGEIIKHYQKWKGYVKCNFKVDGLS